jgi:hypothetical protein
VAVPRAGSQRRRKLGLNVPAQTSLEDQMTGRKNDNHLIITHHELHEHLLTTRNKATEV